MPNNDTLVVTTMISLFFDIETTGLPPRGVKPEENTFDKYDKCRIISIAWTLRNESTVYSQNYMIVDPGESYMYEKIGAEFIHNISREMIGKYGKPVKQVLELFMRDVEAADSVIAHNLSFDRTITLAELYRLGDIDNARILHNTPGICTMLSTVDIVKCPGKFSSSYKWPKLQELYKFLFDENFDNAHCALDDVFALVKCYYKIEYLLN